jgi:hypothetical protein
VVLEVKHVPTVDVERRLAVDEELDAERPPVDVELARGPVGGPPEGDREGACVVF